MGFLMMIPSLYRGMGAGKFDNISLISPGVNAYSRPGSMNTFAHLDFSYLLTTFIFVNSDSFH